VDALELEAEEGRARLR